MTKNLIILLLLIGFCSCRAEEKLIAQNGSEKIIMSRIGEGRYDIFFQRGEEPKLKFWVSFWGEVDIKFSENGNFLAIRDGMRLGVMSVVIIFRVDGQSIVPIYQTPGNFDAEDVYIDFDLGGFQDNAFSIKVMKAEWSEKSRPKMQFEFTYSVNNLSTRRAIMPYFYNEQYFKGAELNWRKMEASGPQY